jgi:thiosulfate/3-mercaptopyruvate sulfurtransferase
MGVIEERSTGTGSFKAGEPANGTASRSSDGLLQKAGTDYIKPEYRTDLFPRGEFLKPLMVVSSSDVVVDVSGSSQGEAVIRDAVKIPVQSFLYQNGTLRPVPEMAGILGGAGISRDEPVVVYGDTFRSGEAAFLLWLLRYLGHDDVKALDGGLDNWIAASMPLQAEESTRPPANYTPVLRTEMLADYDYVKSGAAQVVDARSFQEFGKGRIPNAFFIGPEQVLEKDKVKAGQQLNETFAKLDRELPVVVYSNDLFNTSLVWYALQLMGFDSRIYSWQDWQAHEKSKVYVIG